jgi:hypothetical protein
MSALPLLRVAFIALGLLLFAGMSGFVSGLLGASEVPSATHAAAEGATPLTPRELARALVALDTHGHWGRYAAPEAATDTTVADSTPAAPDAEGLARDFRLVGIERDREGTRALLLPAASAEGADTVMALRVGDEFAQGVRVLRIEADAVVFATADGESTLHLYEPGS